MHCDFIALLLPTKYVAVTQKVQVASVHLFITLPACDISHGMHENNLDMHAFDHFKSAFIVNLVSLVQEKLSVNFIPSISIILMGYKPFVYHLCLTLWYSNPFILV